MNGKSSEKNQLLIYFINSPIKIMVERLYDHFNVMLLDFRCSNKAKLLLKRLYNM